MDAVPTDTCNRLPAARRAAVLTAAEAKFATNGFSRSSLNVIAREAGVAKGSLFQYFDDKADLFAHLCDRAVERIDDAMGDQVDALDWSTAFFPACSELLAE
jgi:AcrR family transcriptional regulator